MSGVEINVAVTDAAIGVSVEVGRLIVDLADGRALSIPLNWYPRLLHGQPQERLNWRLLGGGYAIEWPDLDEHIGIEGLISGRQSSESKVSLEAWLGTRSSEKG